MLSDASLRSPTKMKGGREREIEREREGVKCCGVQTGLQVFNVSINAKREKRDKRRDGGKERRGVHLDGETIEANGAS